jgi:hypothetical protein
MARSVIGRNRKRAVAAIFDGATRCRVFTLENCFNGELVPVEAARRAYETCDDARLYHHGDRYVVHVHSNRWYELFQEQGG